MGIGREVADAYIDVHGDLKKFRKDLEEAAPAGEEAGKEFGESFADGFAKRAQRDLDKKWSSMLDALYSGDKFDIGRMIDNFDPTDIERATDAMRAFGEEAVKAGAIDNDEWQFQNELLQEQIGLMKEAYDADKLHGEAIAENNRLEALHAEAIKENIRQTKILAQQEREDAAWRRVVRDAEAEAFARAEAERHEKRMQEWQEAIRMNEAFERSWTGMTRRMNLNALEQDFKKLGEAMTSADFSKFAKNFDSFDDLTRRVHDVTDAMRENGRISDENAASIHFWTQQYIADQQAKQQAEKDALDAARELREEQERYKASLDGMVEAAHFRKIEQDFGDLTDAIGRADFSKFGNGARDVGEFRDRVIDVANSMVNLGKISGEEFTKILGHLDVVSADLDGYKVKLGNAGDETGKWNLKLGGVKQVAGEILQRLSGTISHLRGLAGLNVLGDTIQQGLDIAKNIDRVALSISTSALKIGSAASIVSTAAGGLVNVVADMSSMAGIAWLAPGFLAAAGIQIGVLVAAFKDMKTKLKDLGPQFSALQDNISDAFWKQAEQPIRNLVDSLMPTLKTQLGETATQLGGLFKALTDGFTKNATPARVEGMFQKMNTAIGIAKGAMEPLASAFVTLGEVGADYFDDFAGWIVDISTQFDDFVTKAAADGRLKQWIDDAIQAFKDTGRAIGGVVEIFQGLNEAAEAAGIGGLTEFADTLERMADIAKSPEFQGPLTEYLQGAKAGAEQIIDAINLRLFPALGNIAPTLATAMDIIGEAMGKAIGYVSDIIENPKVQEGVLALSDGITDAMTKLEPAIKPIGDSLGSLLEISGHIIGNISEVFASFMTNFGPTIDEMGRKVEELADPLTGSVKNAMEQLKPVIENINTYVVTPLVDGLKKIAPEIDKFVQAAGPTLTNITETVGPAIEKFLSTVLPNAVTFALEMGKTFLPFVQGLVELLTPAFATALDEVGAGFKNASEGLKALRGEANEFDLLPQFKDMHDKVDQDWKATWGQKSDNSFWEDLGNVLFGGSLVDMGQRMMDAWSDDITGLFEPFGKTIGDGWNRVWSGKIFGDQPGKALGELGTTIGENWDKLISGEADRDFAGMVREMFPDSAIADFVDGVTGWVEDVQTNIQKAWDGFTGWLDDLLSGGSQGEGEEGGGAHFAGRAVGGKITPEDIGLGAPDENWLEDTFAQVSQGIAGFFSNIASGFASFAAPFLDGWNGFWADLGTNIGSVWEGITTTLSTWWTTITTNIGTWLAGLGEGWNSFWGGFGSTINDIWTQITTTLSTWWTTITTNIGTWLTGLITNWNTFWGQFPTTVQNIWTQITTWISTLAGQISTNISNFITTVSTNWNNFWTGVWTKVQQIWQQITQWIQTQATTIGTNIGNFITTVRTNWDNFWNAVNQKVQTIWATIVGWIAGKTAEIRGKIDSMISTVKTNWENFWSTINQKVTEWWGKIVSGVTEGIGNVVREAGTLGAKALAAVGDTGGLLLQKGVDFAQGFINGIGSMIDDIATAAANFVQAAIDAATNQQDSHSPSKVTHGLGVDYGDGYINGIDSKMDAAAAAGAGLAESALSGIATSKMYAAGVDAALGLADGLASQQSRIDSVMTAMMPDLKATLETSASGLGLATAGQAAVTNITNIEEGAVKVEAKQADPKLVTSTIKDDLDDLFSSSSR